MESVTHIILTITRGPLRLHAVPQMEHGGPRETRTFLKFPNL